jgi:hypothetical protein
MIAAVVTTAAVAAASAFVPAIPIEAYLVAVITTTGTDPVALGIAAGLGQTAGKLLTFLAARGVIRSSRLRRWLGRRPGSGSADGSPLRRAGARTRLRLAGAGERIGMPPLLVTSVYAAGTPCRPPRSVPSASSGDRSASSPSRWSPNWS